MPLTTTVQISSAAKTLFLFLLAFLLIKYSIAVTDNLSGRMQPKVDFTEECTQMANYKDCGVFKKCCQFRCKNQPRTREFCMSLLSQVIALKIAYNNLLQMLHLSGIPLLFSEPHPQRSIEKIDPLGLYLEHLR